VKTYVLLALALVGPSLAAQASTRPVQIVVAGGVSVPTGDFGDTHDLGFHADVSVLFKSLGALRFRPEVSYARFKIKEALGLAGLHAASAQYARPASALATGATGTDLSTLLSGFANLEVPLGSGGFAPFLLGGVGAVSLETDATQSLESLRQTKVSLNLGVGVRFKLGGIGGLIEARLNNVPSDKVKTTFKEARFIPVTFGLVF
jgi:opacity protein-like surface antigen